MCAPGTIETHLMSRVYGLGFSNFQAYGAGVIDFENFFLLKEIQ